MREDFNTFVTRVRAIVARYTLDGPLPTWFAVTGDELETAAIVRAKMARIKDGGTDADSCGDPAWSAG
mgnify:CR=1 FL=1